ncbi:MAG: VTT domain-containing protein [Oscillospiraceae bacterium]|nr:VTT domain-containing protein [Oscillospiraceae bacterium]
MKQAKTKKVLRWALGGALIAALAGVTVYYWPQISDIITKPEARDAFITYVRENPVPGILAFLALQILQMIVAVIPGEPIELCGGVLFGAFGGLAVCMAGALIGTALIYFTVKAFGAKSIDEKKLEKYKFLRDPQHIKILLFLLFFIPGTPKDILTYLGPFLPVRPLAFFSISTVARIPSIFTSTYAADAALDGRWTEAVIVFAITGAAALVCILLQDKILGALRRFKKHPAEK